MKRAKRALQVVMAGASAALVVGCEALSFDGAPAAAPTADEVAMASVTRQRVQAELREAQRLGLITVGEESPRVMTAEEVRLVAEAGEAAATAQAHAPKAK